MSLQQASDMTRSKLLEWKMAILWFFFFTVVSLSSAILTSLMNANWSTMDGQGKVEMALGIVVSWGTTMMAFFSKAAKKVENDLGLEEPIVKQVTNTQQQTTIESK